MTQATDTRLIERLRETIGKCVLDDGTLVPVTFVNRDGPEAASRIESLRAEVATLREALDIARKQVVELACIGTSKLRDAGYECDPPERTYIPILELIDTALGDSREDSARARNADALADEMAAALAKVRP